MRRFRMLMAVSLLASATGAGAYAQDAREMIKTAVDAEIAADKSDLSVWRYLDTDDNLGKKVVAMVVETRHGTVQEAVSRDGHPLSLAEIAAEKRKRNDFLRNPEAQQKQKRNGEQDDAKAQKMLKLLPAAFAWTVKSQDGNLTTLHFEPEPSFHAPDRESEVLAAMAGEVVVQTEQHRIKTIRGALTQDVKFGWGLLATMRKGGTFDVERRELAPGIWQITETHVHIEGHALLFKSIAQQEDDVHTEIKPVAESTTLEQAAAMLDQAGTQTGPQTGLQTGTETASK